MRIYPKIKLFIFVSVVLIYGATAKSWGNIRLAAGQYTTYGIPLFKDVKARGLSMSGINYPILKIYPRDYNRSALIDSTGRYYEVSEQIFNIPLYLPARYPLEYFQNQARDYYRDLNWQKFKIEHLSGDLISKKKKGGGIDIDIPVKIKSRAFQTIFGGDRVGLTVSGNITINGGFRHEDRSEVRTAVNRGSDYNFKMEQTQQFRVTGNVGDKVTVSVDQDSERPFDFENTIKLNYDGYEDEIIKKIEAGNISLSLPATRFVSFSGKNSGLFGIKAQMAMGNLNVTTIASQEKGENKKLTYSGGASEGVQKIEDYRYLKNQYFFLDEVYRNNYFGLYKQGLHNHDLDRIIADIEVYLNTTEQDQEGIWGFAAADPQEIQIDSFTTTQEHVKRYWKRLEKTDYFVATDLGYIRLNNPVGDGDYLAVAYRDTSELNNGLGRIYGDIPFNVEIDSLGEQKDPIHLRLIKSANTQPNDITWKLMFRHIYYLGARDIEEDGFELKIYYRPPSGDNQETVEVDGEVKSYLELFGLDRVDETGDTTKTDNKIDNNSSILRLSMGELEFPSLEPFNEMLPDDKKETKMYTSTVQNEINGESNFFIEVKSKSRSSTLSLGWNVIEGSEEVRLNGRVLSKGSDYIIDYYSGTLTVLDEQATSPSADLEVTYQRNELFQLEKKTLIGMRAEYDLWENSFIGGTFLYLNQRTLDQKVRVGKGPMRNLIWDLNTALEFKPDFLTRAIDALPLIQTKQPSSLKFEGEIAQILPNPNTLNNESTHDPDGVAYIDDFEAVKKITPLGVIQGGWTMASMPLHKKEKYFGQNGEKKLLDKYLARLYWYNDYNMTPIKEIWPNKETNPNTANNVHVLSMVMTANEGADSLTNSWAGIMKPLSSGYADQSDSKFLEIWVKGNSGMLHIDLGQISEDVIPNDELNTEDERDDGIRNGLLDPGEDVGIDGMKGTDPEDFWDLNGDGIQDEGEPKSWDDWYYNPPYDYDQSNGTEGNENNVNGRIPDTEDINRNGTLDMVDSYFEYTFSLSKSHPDSAKYIKGSNESEDYPNPTWFLYRIPLADADTIGNPDIGRLEFARIWVDSLTSSTSKTIKIAEINIVGNDWKEMGVAESDTSNYEIKGDYSIVIADVVNTHENPLYEPPRGVSGVKDRITRVEAKEQSLVIKIDSLKCGSNAILQKTFYQPENYIHYDKMKMFIHGDEDNFYDSSDSNRYHVEFFLRFGANDKNYYEIRKPVYRSWEGNDLEVDLSELSQLKFKNEDIVYGADSALIRVIRDTTFSDSTKWRVIGEPSLTNVKQLVLGVENISKEIEYFSGEIWVNELRLSGVHKDKGYAMRARVDLKLADVFNINAEINKQDADFHNINTRFGSGNNKESITIGTGLQLHKFLPRSWGLSLPVTFNYKSNESSPKYFPGSDILVTDTPPDSIKNISSSKGYGISFRKTTKSNNFLIKHTIDNFSANFNGAESQSSNSTTKKSTRKTYTAAISYSLNFSKKTHIRPFFWLGKIPLIKKVSELKLYYLPTGLTLKASGNQTKTYTELRSGLPPTKERPFTITRSAQTGIKPFTNLSFDFSRSYKSSLTNIEKPKDELLKLKFGELTNLDQSASTKFNPKLVTWLTTNFSYTTSYKWSNNLQSKSTGTGIKANNNSSLTGAFSFDPNKLIKSLTGGSKKRSSQRRRQQPKKKDTRDSEDAEKDKKKKKSGPSIFKRSLTGIGNFTKKFQAISINITRKNNASYSGLKDEPISPYFMFGLDDSTGVDIVEGLGTNTGALGENLNLTLQSSVKVMKNIDVSLRFSSDRSKNVRTQTTGNSSHSTFKLSKDDSLGIPFPEWTVRWSGLEKIPFFKGVVQKMGFDHNFSGKSSSSWQDNKNKITKESYSANFRPLIGLNITWKHNISTTIKYNRGLTSDRTKAGGSGESRTNTSDFSIQGSYSRSGGFRIPIPVWPFKNKEFKNNIDIALSFNLNQSVSEQNKIGKWTEMNNTKNWSFKPKLTYRFSNNVSGGLHFEYGKNDSKQRGKTTYQDFGINVRIEIRGN